MDYLIIFVAVASGLYFHWWLYRRIRQWSDRDLALSLAEGDAAKAPALRGTAFGLFNLACGVAMLLASALAGLLWDQWGARSTFVTGAALALVALLGLLRLPRPTQRPASM